MHRIDSAGNVGNRFASGNPATGQRSTKQTPEWLNDVQENLAKVVEDAGIALAKGDFTQLKAAINAMIGQSPHLTQILEGKWLHTSAYDATHYLPPYGQSLLRADYPAAWTAIQASGMIAADHAAWVANPTLWGPGVDANHFDMMDLRAVFLRIENGGKGGALGPALGHFKGNQNANHRHSLPSYSNDDTGDGAVADSTGTATLRTAYTGYQGGDEAVPDHVSATYVIRMK